MACSTCSGNRSVPATEPIYVVTFADGRREEVQGQRAAKIKVVANPGATYAAK